MSRLRIRLAKMLEEAMLSQHKIEITVDPDDFQIAEGWYRSAPQADAFRWEVFGRFPGSTVGPSFASYTTMTQIVKSGKADIAKTTHSIEYEVYDATGN